MIGVKNGTSQSTQIPMSHVLKILAGALEGVEYALSSGETVFHIGPHEDLANGRAAELLGADENAYYIPADLPADAFAIRVVAGEERVQLGGRARTHDAWTWHPLPDMQPVQAGGIHVAVRQEHVAWSPEILAFVPPSVPMEYQPVAADGRPPAGGRQRPMVLLGVSVMLTLTLGVAWYYWQHQPDARVRGLASVLSNAPEDYAIAAGSDGHLYAFSDSAAARTWGERASRRVQRRTDVYLLRREEARRLERALIAAGVEVVVVRLDDPARPEVVLSGQLTAARSTHATSLVAARAPYVKTPRVTAISDHQLVALARQELQVLGISTRTEPRGQRVSIVNDVYLDDAGLNAMTGAARTFHQRWGVRRISVAPQLWDDLLKGRSYRYSPGQLLSVGSGRWDYAGGARHAAP